MHCVTAPAGSSHSLASLRHGWIPVFLLALSAALLPAAAVAADPIPIKVATLAPEGTAWIKILRAMTIEVEKELEGRVKFTVYGGGVQGTEKVVVQKMKTGQLQAGALTVVGLSIIAPEIMALNLPMVFSSDDHMAATRVALGDRLEQKIWDSGYKMINWGGVGGFYLFSKHPIRNPDDLVKGRIWVWNGDPVFNEMALEIGAAPIPLGVPDVLSALNTGQVDTVLMNPFALVSLQWFTQMKYRMSEPILFGVGGMAIARSTWEKLTPEDQEVFLAVNRKWAMVHKKKSDRDNQRAIQLVDAQGIEVVTPSPSDLAAWKKVSAQTADRLAGRVYSEELLREMLQHRDRLRPASTP
jgi:TRAP-type C4-dicarboxylate transport system substrate-binding protein